MPIKKTPATSTTVSAPSEDNKTSIDDIVGKPQDEDVTSKKSKDVGVAAGTLDVPLDKNETDTSSDTDKPLTSISSPNASRFVPRSYFNQIEQPGITEEVSGILDIQPEGHGFLRPKFIPSHRDIYISQSQIRRFLLRPGDLVKGVARPPKDTERYFGLLKVEEVNGIQADISIKRPYFDDLVPMYPKKQVVLTTGKTPLSTRIIDIVSPIGFGQRGMIVSPPKAGKTTILKEIAAGISKNFPDVHIMAALIGERPEEVTDISQSVKGDVVASNFDEPPDDQTRVAEITLDRAKRLVELGKDVIILLDSVTRLARAYNLSIEPSGRTLTGGFDPAALWPAKKFFGAARNCQEGGSLTIIGTALVETGSRMDDLIYEEFKGTGNMELHLDRKLADRRIFPAINVERSGTRQEELILSEKEYKRVVTMRRMIDMLSPEERTSILVEKLSKTQTNEEFLESLGKG
ncbi:MAG: transcription termination factor Rho [Candidatus Levybacteria bacterium]|nr:transcription termination factor Rho [Candidatus Levybacteria bacterium]